MFQNNLHGYNLDILFQANNAKSRCLRAGRWGEYLHNWRIFGVIFEEHYHIVNKEVEYIVCHRDSR